MHLHEVLGLNFDGWIDALMYMLCICIDASCINVKYKHVHMVVVNGTKSFYWQNLKKKNNFIFHNMYFCHGMLWKNTIYDLKKKVEELNNDMAF